jgi:hypothetical protein
MYLTPLDNYQFHFLCFGQFNWPIALLHFQRDQLLHNLLLPLPLKNILQSFFLNEHQENQAFAKFHLIQNQNVSHWG